MNDAFSSQTAKKAVYHSLIDGHILNLGENFAGHFNNNDDGYLVLNVAATLNVALQSPSGKDPKHTAELCLLRGNEKQKLCNLYFLKTQNGHNENVLVGHFDNFAGGAINVKIVKNTKKSEKAPADRFIYAATSFGRQNAAQSNAQDSSSDF